MENCTLVKLGGSLLTMPGLAESLLSLIDSNFESPLLLVGGGKAADIVRETAEHHRLSDEVSHALAIRAMDFNSSLVASLHGRLSVVHKVNELRVDAASGRIPILHPSGFLSELEAQTPRTSHLPRSWDVTSDSIAAWIAIQLGIQNVVLLKSAEISSVEACQSTTLRRLSEQGLVDPWLRRVAVGSPAIAWCNLRATVPALTWLQPPQ